MKNNLISIIIPCYNQAQYLEKSVQSVLDQTYQDIEIIIVNDGSTDNTQQVAEMLRKAHPNKIYVIEQKNQGLSEARNNGILKSSGNYILPLDSDDIIDKEMLTRCLQIMTDYNVDLVSSDGQAFGERDYKIKTQEFPVCNILYANCFIPATLFRRKVWEKAGGYKKNMDVGYEDWEFWINAYKHEFKFERCPEILFYYRTKVESMLTEAFKKDAYLKAKIAVNNPKLFTVSHVNKSIHIIKETETLADIYFYCNDYQSKELEKYILGASHHISLDSLQEKQIILIENIKIGLCSLDLYEDIESIQKLLKEMGVQSILFYAPLRYEVANLKQSEFAWTEGKGIEPAEGNIFPFVPKSIRENPHSQLIAYRRLMDYQNKKTNTKIAQQKVAIENKIKTVEKQENRIQEKNKLLDEKDILIQNKNKLIDKKDALINNQIKTIESLHRLLNSVKTIINFSFFKRPIKKYQAYKAMIQVYYSISKKNN